MDHWFAPVKRRSELGFSCLLHCSTSHAIIIITAHRCLTMLKCLSSVWTSALTKHGLVADEVCRFQRLISRAGSISFIIRCSGCFHVPRHSAATADVVRGDIPSLTWRTSKMCFHTAVSRPCMDKRPGGDLQGWFDFLKSEMVWREQLWMFCTWGEWGGEVYS